MIFESLADKPDMFDFTEDVHAKTWPVYLNEGNNAIENWQQLVCDYAKFQFLMMEQDNDYLALITSLPCYWDGKPENLLEGYDACLTQALESTTALRNTLCVLSMIVNQKYAQRNISSTGFSLIKKFAKSEGFKYLIVPVRPTLKSKYPLISIDDYMHWKRKNGQPFDPWIRAHLKNNAIMLKSAPRSATIIDTVEQWQKWTGLFFGSSGEYLIEGALSPLKINLEKNMGEYIEPNIWFSYPL